MSISSASILQLPLFASRVVSVRSKGVWILAQFDHKDVDFVKDFCIRFSLSFTYVSHGWNVDHDYRGVTIKKECFQHLELAFLPSFLKSRNRCLSLEFINMAQWLLEVEVELLEIKIELFDEVIVASY
ncbi:hypothetical protein VNO78_09481 [Psophocarpus tetragonolobus]|uniref:Uncharacterized protein n=1 Tax=Psophocarpus tetragonolobus TaxID=3891 RepID=A0AAN9XTL7_PSOTE